MKYEKVSNFICIISLIYEEFIQRVLLFYIEKNAIIIHKILETPYIYK